MAVSHRTTPVLLRATGRPADHLGHEKLEPCRCNAMVGFVHARVRVQPGIDHDPIDEVIDHRAGRALHAESCEPWHILHVCYLCGKCVVA